MQISDFLQVYNYDKKVRYGVNGDGGYVIADMDGGYDCYISAGVSNEESFSRDFINKYDMNEYNSFAFDGTINNYPYEYTTSISFTRKNININNDEHNTNLDTLIDKYTNIFLKIDIEGGEYPWILSLTEHQLDKFKQIAIEIHGLNSNEWHSNQTDKIACLEKLSKTHYIVHAHGNNHRPAINGIPEVIELTYVNKRFFHGIPRLNTTKLPIHNLDFPNLSYANDIELNIVPFVHKPNYNINIKYGIMNNNIDVTNIALEKCVSNGVLVIPRGDHERADLFTDPLEGVLKVIIIQNNGQTTEYDHTQEIRLPLKRLNIAICYWGMTRSTKKVYKSHQSCLFDRLTENNINYKIFMHSWKTSTNLIWGQESSTPIDYDEYKLLNPDYYHLDNQSDFLDNITFSDYFSEDLFNKYGGDTSYEWHPHLIKNHLCALESQKRVTNIMLSQNQHFDLVIYVRPDVEITTPLLMNFLNIQLNEIAIPDFDHFEGYNDRFAIVPFENCKQYAHRIDEIIDFRKNNGRIVSEKYVKFIANKYFTNIHFINFHFNIVRS